MSLLSPAQQVSTDTGCQSRCPSALPFSVNARDGQSISTLAQDARGFSPWVVSWNSPKPPGPGASRRTVRLPHRPRFVSFGILRRAGLIRQAALHLKMMIQGPRQHERVRHRLNLTFWRFVMIPPNQVPSASETVLLITNRSGVWNVKINGRFYGDYMRQELAIEAAFEKRREIETNGGNARVLAP